MLCTAQCELGITTGKSESVWSNTAKVTSNVYRSGGRRIIRLEKSLCTSQREGAVSVWEARDSLHQSTSCISPQLAEHLQVQLGFWEETAWLPA